MKKILCIILGLLFIRIASADTVNIDWLVDGQTYTQTSCTVGGDIILPTAPTKRGYTFLGWAVGYDLSTLNTAIDGDVHYAIGESGKCWYRTSSMSSNSQLNCTDDNYADLTGGKWKTKFSYGTLYGISKCSNTGGKTQGETGNPVDTSAENCWCKVTNFVPFGEEDMLYEVFSSWIFHSKRSSLSVCVDNCANYCSDGLQSYLSVRIPLLSSSAN